MLDNMWVCSSEVSFDPPLSLKEGTMPGNGQGSFRGDTYSGVIERASGKSLYADLSELDVAWIALALDHSRPEVIKELGEIEGDDLIRMFAGYAIEDAALHAWW